jgi:predicted Ser/Thr protein kinase
MKEMQYYNKLLGYYREKSMRFSQFIEAFVEDPTPCLHTSATLIHAAIKHFGYRIVVRSGEPTISYRIFEDPFSGGINAVYGQEFSISQLVDLIESIGKESGPNRGIVLVGPPASGKTNIADLISMAIEVYSKEEEAKLYAFYYEFTNEKGRILEVRSSFMHNPILLFPVILKLDGQITHPRQDLFDFINSKRNAENKVVCPTYYQNATLDKLNLDILKTLLENPRMSDILSECNPR